MGSSEGGTSAPTESKSSDPSESNADSDILAGLYESESEGRQILNTEESPLRARDAELKKEAAFLDRMRDAIVRDKRDGKDTSARDAEYKRLLERYEKKAAQFERERKALMWRGDLLQTLRQMQSSTFEALKIKERPGGVVRLRDLLAKEAEREESSSPDTSADPSSEPHENTSTPPIEKSLLGKWKLVRGSDGYVFEFELLSDRTGTYNSYDPAYPKRPYTCEWEVYDGRLHLSSPKGQPQHVSYSYKIEGNRLIDDLGVSYGESFLKQ